MEINKDNYWVAFLFTFILLCIYSGITRGIQAYKCPKMTNTELFLNTGNTLLLDFKECEND